MIRLATPEDAAAILEIYRPSIEESPISFETEVPTPAEIGARIERCLEKYPWLVEEQQGKIRGYAYASKYHERAAYRWSANVSVYVGPDHQRKGVAGSLYRVLFKILEEQRIRKTLAAITVPNSASQEFHESLGFEAMGVMVDVGYKLDEWLSMGWWQRPLGKGAESAPDELVLFHKIASRWSGDLSNYAQ